MKETGHVWLIQNGGDDPGFVELWATDRWPKRALGDAGILVFSSAQKVVEFLRHRASAHNLVYDDVPIECQPPLPVKFSDQEFREILRERYHYRGRIIFNVDGATLQTWEPIINMHDY